MSIIYYLFTRYLLTNDPKYTGVTANDYDTRYDKTGDEQCGFRRSTPFIDCNRART